jgi:hypothetical protein
MRTNISTGREATTSTITPNEQTLQEMTTETVEIPEMFADLLRHTRSVQAMRQNVRSWFLANIEGWEERPGSPLHIQCEHFALLDDFLASMLVSPPESQAV